MQKFEFREQLKDRGCFVSFEFEAKLSGDVECEAVYNYFAESEWELPCRMAVRLFESYLFKVHPGKLEVTIYKVKWLPADTNCLVVLFAMVKALAECFDTKLVNLGLDVYSEVFKFPEPRSII